MLYVFAGALFMTTYAQIRINDPGRVVERQAENRANRKVDQAVDKGFDSLEDGIGNLFKKKDKKG
jgi:OOP family OmpA-OmpF porin